MHRKKRILVCGEASYLNSGFGLITYNILSRLHQTGKYEVAEFSQYGHVNDQRDHIIKWRFYANAVRDDDDRSSQYKADPMNQFGKWRFERVLLDFKPDIVFSFTDYWMLEHQNLTSLRPFFHWCIEPPIDSAPQKTEWIDTFIQADSVLPYTDWGKKVLDVESNGKIKTICSASPGIELDLFTPVQDKILHRKNMSCETDINVIGTVMRNQRRKLYPDLIATFARFLEICKERNNEELANKSYLYIHTSYPDVGWNLPQIIKEHGIGHKILFTYICRHCHKPSCSFFNDARYVCPHCNHVAAVLPSVSEGLSREQLADVYKLFDIYIQYSIAEGLAVPLLEAGACGIPTMAVDYSAMSEVVRNINGMPLKVQRMFFELESHAYRALPDNEYAAEQLYSYSIKNDAEKRAHSRKIRRETEKHYNWDNMIGKLVRHFDSIELQNLQGKWDETPPNIRKPAPKENIPNGLTHEQFLHWVIDNVLCDPSYKNSYDALCMLRNLNHGAVLVNRKLHPFDRDGVYDTLFNRAQRANECEMGRCGLKPLINEDYIVYANMKDQINK